MRKPNETISQFAIRVAWETGHFWSPENPEGKGVTQEDLLLLKPGDPVVVAAMISMSRMDASRYTRHVLDQHGRNPTFDGDAEDPAIQAMVSEVNGRCPIPDFAPPPGVVFAFEDPDLQEVVLRMQRDAAMGAAAFGSGNWKGCHSVGEFHSASIKVNTSGLPSFLQPLFQTVLQNVRKAYAGVGLLFRFIDQSGKDIVTGELFSGSINSDMSFVSSSSGWIGLAIIGQGETCSSKIWCKFLNTYRGGSDNASIITQWTTLIKHELGHNCGRNHTSGGVMNPSIVNGLPVDWVSGDPSTSWLKGQFGGVPVPTGGGPIPPDPPSTIEQQLKLIRTELAVREGVDIYSLLKIKELEARIKKLEGG